MANFNMPLMILCISLLPLPSWCHEDDDYSSESSWEEVSFQWGDSSQYLVPVGCDETHRLAPGLWIYFVGHHVSSTKLRDFYLNCIGKVDCDVSKEFIEEVRPFTKQGHRLLKYIIICLPDHLFLRPNSFEQLTIPTDHPDFGFILRDHKKQNYQGINISIGVEEGQRILLDFFYTEKYSLDEELEVPIRLSGGLENKCIYIEDTTYPRHQVEVGPEINKVIIFFPRCSNTGQFAIGYFRYFTGYTPAAMPSDWNVSDERYRHLNPRESCISKCTPTSHSVTPPLDDRSITEAINADRGASAAVIGVSVVAGLLLATIVVVAVIFLLWKRNMLALPVQSNTVREAAPTPTKQKDDNPTDGDYSQPYDNVRTPDILNNRNGSNGNLYAEVTKDRSRPPLVTGSSLHIEENDLYPRPGVDAPRRGPRESASVNIVENGGYDSFGTT